MAQVKPRRADGAVAPANRVPRPLRGRLAAVAGTLILAALGAWIFGAPPRRRAVLETVSTISQPTLLYCMPSSKVCLIMAYMFRQAMAALHVLSLKSPWAHG